MNNFKFRYAPDAAIVKGSASNATPHKISGVPQKDVDLMDVAKAVAEKWLANPGITLAYIDAAGFNDLVASYATQLGSRISTGALRPGLTQTLAQLDVSIDAGVKEVKVYLQKKYKKDNATPYFAKFGIERYHKGYQLPKDRNKRLLALKSMKEAIATEGFGAEEYGTAFWNDIYTAYNTGLSNSNTTDGKVSEQVAGKNTHKKNIKKVMASLRYILRGNYPDTYKAVYRSWGWQKENY